MKNLCLLFTFLFFNASLHAQLQYGNLTASWIENQKDFYILSDNTAPEDVNQVDRAQMQPKFYTQDVKYSWVNGAFTERAITIKIIWVQMVISASRSLRSNIAPMAQ